MEIQPVKSKQSNCPACKISFGFVKTMGMFMEPNMRAIFVESHNKLIPDVTHFEFQCRRCCFRWSEIAD